MSDHPQAETSALRVVLAAEALRFAWPGVKTPCIDIEAFRITAGESVFLHGPSGCGKSTLPRSTSPNVFDSLWMRM